jgi:hypothetical protein
MQALFSPHTLASALSQQRGGTTQTWFGLQAPLLHWCELEQVAPRSKGAAQRLPTQPAERCTQACWSSQYVCSGTQILAPLLPLQVSSGAHSPLTRQLVADEQRELLPPSAPPPSAPPPSPPIPPSPVPPLAPSPLLPFGPVAPLVPSPPTEAPPLLWPAPPASPL